MIAKILAQALSVVVMNWTFFVTLQSVMMFRRALLSLWKRLAFFMSGTVAGLFSSFLMILSILGCVMFIFGREGSFYINDYLSTRAFPLVSLICLEFAEVLVFFVKYSIVGHTKLEECKTRTTVITSEEFQRYFAAFQKPNLALLQ